MRVSVLKTFSVVDSQAPRVSREHPKAVGAEAMGGGGRMARKRNTSVDNRICRNIIMARINEKRIVMGSL